MQVLNLKNVYFKRANNLLLNNLNWEVLKGENWVILGENGAGKTLILCLLTGHLWPTDGEITLLGHKFGTVDIRVLRQSIGWVAKALEELVPPQVTVLEAILSGYATTLMLYEKPDKQMIEEAEKLAKKFSLHELLKREFTFLSSGQKQRVLLARALINKPKILFLDEPTANLDLAGREIFLKTLDDLVEDNKELCIILITHNTLDISSYINKALLIKEGSIIAKGDLNKVVTDSFLSKAFNLNLKVEKTKNNRYLAYLNY